MMMDAILFYCMHCEPRLVTVYMWVCCDWCIDGPSRLLWGLPTRWWNNSLWYVSTGLSPCLSWTWTWASTWGKMELSALCEYTHWYWLASILLPVYKLPILLSFITLHFLLIVLSLPLYWLCNAQSVISVWLCTINVLCNVMCSGVTNGDTIQVAL